MKDLINRLLEDMRGRFYSAGKDLRPSRAEIASWGGFNLTWPVRIGGGCGLQVLGLMLFSAISPLSEGAGQAIAVATFFGIPILVLLSGLLQRGIDLQSYRKWLETNDRVVLMEYSRLLDRELAKAQNDPALGGAIEIERLRGVQQQIKQVLESGVDLQQTDRVDTLKEEAELAESVLSMYTTDGDDLKQLDARLPQEIRSKLEAEDREGQQRPASAEEPG